MRSCQPPRPTLNGGNRQPPTSSRENRTAADSLLPLFQCSTSQGVQQLLAATVSSLSANMEPCSTVLASGAHWWTRQASFALYCHQHLQSPLLGKRSASSRRRLSGSGGQAAHHAEAIHRLVLWVGGLSTAGEDLRAAADRAHAMCIAPHINGSPGLPWPIGPAATSGLRCGRLSGCERHPRAARFPSRP